MSPTERKPPAFFTFVYPAPRSASAARRDRPPTAQKHRIGAFLSGSRAVAAATQAPGASPMRSGMCNASGSDPSASSSPAARERAQMYCVCISQACILALAQLLRTQSTTIRSPDEPAPLPLGAPPSVRSSRSTEVTTTEMPKYEF